MRTITVTVRPNGNGYTARAGRGKKAKTATCTSSFGRAVRAAAAKAFGLDECNVQTAEDIEITGEYSRSGGTFVATLPDLPEAKGGV